LGGRKKKEKKKERKTNKKQTKNTTHIWPNLRYVWGDPVRGTRTTQSLAKPKPIATSVGICYHSPLGVFLLG